ncbi:hypothetical protein QTP88_011403 [Uroleucon formosanum]
MFYFKEHDELPQLSLNIGLSSDLADLGTLDTGPYRPVLSTYTKTKFGKQYRSFQSEWFKNYEWLEYSIKSNAAFCFVCRIFGTSSVEDIWTKIGCNNWQKFIVKIGKHQNADVHKTNLTKMVAYKTNKQSGSIMVKLSDAHRNQIAENRAYMAQIIEIVLYLGKQGVAFRGHSEKYDYLNQGNFKELCNVFSKCVPNFKSCYDVKINHTSWKVQEEIIQISADYAREKIIKEITNTGFFAIMVDEARSHKQELLCICIRYVVDLEIVERFMEFVDVSSGQDANHIVAAIFRCFEKLRINMNTLYIVAQSYDGASVMSGCLGGVQAKIKEHYSCAIYTHCMAHRLNLVVVDMCKGIKIARSVFNTLESVYVHFSRPSNNSELVKIQLQLGLKKGNILRVCDTRWVCRFKNCESMLKNNSAVLNFLNNEVDIQADKDVLEAIGILNQIQKCQFLIFIIILKEILGIINILSTSLQSKTATLGKARNVVNGVIQSFICLRSDDEFSKLWATVVELAEKHNILLEVSHIGSKRKRAQPVHLNEFHLETTTGAEQDDQINASDSIELYYRCTVYFPIIDTIINNLRYRFSEESLEMASSIDCFMEMDYEKSQYFINHYKVVMNINLNLLKSEMLVLKNCLPSNYNHIIVKNICKEPTFPNVYKMLQVALTIPVSSATCERSFSSMRCLKNWLRASMEQQRFTDLAILNIERDIVNKITSSEILEKYSTIVKLTLLSDRMFLYIENERSTSTEVIGAYFMQEVSFKSNP